MDQSTTSKARPMTSTQGSWFAILAVAIAAFALVTSEFLPVGVLNSVAADLHISVGTAGLIITVPGIMAAIAAPLLPVSVKQLDRRYVHILLTAIMVIANCRKLSCFIIEPFDFRDFNWWLLGNSNCLKR